MAPPAVDLPARLAEALAELRPEPCAAVLGVSGGADSVALALAWAELLRIGQRRDAVALAHFDHGLRAESAADADWVAALAARLGLPFAAAAWTDRPATPSEAAARTARYRFLGEVAAARGADTVATAHTLDDQAETVLLAALRGTGLHGLAGMAADRLLPGSRAATRLLRPLLGERRAALREYLAVRNQEWREDASNADPRFRRNRLRNSLLPALRAEFNPRVEEALVRLAAQARGAAAALDRQADAFLDEHWQNNALPLAAVHALDLADRENVFRRLWEHHDWPRGRMGAREWRRLATLADRPDRGLELPDGVVLRKRRGVLAFARREAPS